MVAVRERLGFMAGGLIALLLFAWLAVSIDATPAFDPARGNKEKTPEQELAEKKEKRQMRLERRLEALAKAEAAGIAGQTAPEAATPARGWLGEQPMDTVGDDWEPAIAADPNSPYVYAIVTRYGVPKPCSGNCPTPWIALEVSADGGATWSDGRPLCACKGGGQYDPIIEVVPSTGHVYAVFMNGFNVEFIKSTDHGATWSAPVKTYENVAWNDKPVLAMSDDGRHVYVTWNGPTGGDPFVAQSHDFGATWEARKLVDSREYYFAFDADVASDGTVYFSESSITYGNAGSIDGPIRHHVFISRDAGATFEDHVVAIVQPGPACDAEGCSADFYVGHTALSVDAAGDVVLLHDGAPAPGAPQRSFAWRSTDAGTSWSGPVALSTNGESATAPAVESRGSGDVRAFWYETSGGSDDAWNVWYRSSSNGGASWTSAVRISDAATGAAYKSAAGFLEVYGDYGELAITSAGKSIAIWGEGFSWIGPGGAWFNIER